MACEDCGFDTSKAAHTGPDCKDLVIKQRDLAVLQVSLWREYAELLGRETNAWAPYLMNQHMEFSQESIVKGKALREKLGLSTNWWELTDKPKEAGHNG